MKDILILVDCQYDFIDGSLACQNSKNAITSLKKHIDDRDIEVRYSADWHSTKNKSFIDNGGIWPSHCVQYTKGAEIHEIFQDLKDPNNRPSDLNVYYKGQDDDIEEYSCFNAKRKDGKSIRENVQNLEIGGIATEFCVKESVIAFSNEGIPVKVIVSGLAYVDEENHLKTLEELSKLENVTLIDEE